MMKLFHLNDVLSQIFLTFLLYQAALGYYYNYPRNCDELQEPVIKFQGAYPEKDWFQTVTRWNYNWWFTVQGDRACADLRWPWVIKDNYPIRYRFLNFRTKEHMAMNYADNATKPFFRRYYPEEYYEIVIKLQWYFGPWTKYSSEIVINGTTPNAKWGPVLSFDYVSNPITRCVNLSWKRQLPVTRSLLYWTVWCSSGALSPVKIDDREPSDCCSLQVCELELDAYTCKITATNDQGEGPVNPIDVEFKCMIPPPTPTNLTLTLVGNHTVTKLHTDYEILEWKYILTWDMDEPVCSLLSSVNTYTITLLTSQGYKEYHYTTEQEIQLSIQPSVYFEIEIFAQNRQDDFSEAAFMNSSTEYLPNPTTEPPWTTLPLTTTAASSPTTPPVPTNDDSEFLDSDPTYDRSFSRYYLIDDSRPIEVGDDFFPFPFFTAPILDLIYNDTCITAKINPEYKTKDHVILYKFHCLEAFNHTVLHEEVLYPEPEEKIYQVNETFCLTESDGLYLNDTIVICQALAETKMYRSLNATGVIRTTNRTAGLEDENLMGGEMYGMLLANSARRVAEGALSVLFISLIANF